MTVLFDSLPFRVRKIPEDLVLRSCFIVVSLDLLLLVLSLLSFFLLHRA